MFRIHLLPAIAVCACCLWLVGCEARGTGFDSAAPGSLPQDWAARDSQAGRWAVVQDRSAPSRPFVLAQLSPAPPGVFSLAVLQTEQIADGSVSVKFKPVSGSQDRSGGLVWRYRDSRNYYLARASALANSLSVLRVQNGRPVPLAARGKPTLFGVERRVPSQSWSTLKVSFRGSRFRVYFNHRQLLEVEDGAFPGPGKVGLLTEADSVTYFDDFRIERKR